MDFIEVGQLMIKPFDLEQLLEVKMEQKRNEHTTLSFYGIVKDGVEEKGLEEVNQGTPIQFCHGDKVLFSGILQTVQSSKNVDTSATLKYSITAGTALESSCSGSSITMDGNIDMKAALIKEN